MSHHPTRPAAGGWLGRLAAPVAVGVVLVAAVGIRVAALPFESPDYRFYLSKWYAHLQQQGFTGFAQAFAEYNPPYLYLLYLVSLLGPPAIVAVKVVSALGDLSLAVGVLAVVRQAGRSRRVAVAAALTVLVVPTVVLNSAFWGQCDALHTSLLLWTLVLLLRDAHARAWLLFGAALAVKLQAVFFLPFLLVVWLLRTRGRRWLPVLAAGPPLLALVPAWAAGRSWDSLVDIYAAQAGSVSFLSYAPNLWSWFPSGASAVLSRVALAATGLACLALAGLAVWRRDRLRDPRGVLALATVVLLVVPFLLPHMRERYFYAGEIFLVALAFALPAASYAAVGVLAVSFLANLENLMHVRLPWSYGQLSLVVLAALAHLGVLAFRRRAVPAPQAAREPG